jgi:xylonate dehydratase
LLLAAGRGRGVVGHGDEQWTPKEAAERLASRSLHPCVRADPSLPPDTGLWGRLQAASGGLWGGCVYDHDAIIELLDRVSGRLPTAGTV